MSKIYLLIETDQKGPYSEEQVRAMYLAGTITSDVHYWQEGQSEWLSIDGLFASQQAEHPSIPESEIAQNQSPRIVQPSSYSESQQDASNINRQSVSEPHQTVIVSNPLVLVLGILLGLGLPPFGLFMGLTMLASPRDRSYAPAILIVSIVGLVVWTIFLVSANK